MNLTDVGVLLKSSGFSELGTNLEEIVLYHKREENLTYMLILCNFMGHNRSTTEQLRHIQGRIALDERFGPGRREILLLLFTRDMVYGREMIRAGLPCWIVDGNTGMLMVYEDQMSDFAGIRGSLEVLLAKQGILEKKLDNSQFTPVNMVLIIINVVIFVLMSLFGEGSNGERMIRWGAICTPIMESPQETYRIFSSMFLHFDVGHLTSNMIVLVALGDNLERALGKWRYLVLYLISGVGAGISSTIYNIWMENNVIAAGASGAIFGVIGALFFLVIKNKGKLEELTAPRMVLMIAYILYSGFTTPGVDNVAHVGGLLMGILLAVLLQKRTRGKRGKV